MHAIDLFVFPRLPIMASQYTGSDLNSMKAVNIVFPLGTVMELLCYVGLLKVAEEIKNPFGGGDESFDLNFLISRHLKISLLSILNHSVSQFYFIEIFFK